MQTTRFLLLSLAIPSSSLLLSQALLPTAPSASPSSTTLRSSSRRPPSTLLRRQTPSSLSARVAKPSFPPARTPTGSRLKSSGRWVTSPSPDHAETSGTRGNRKTMKIARCCFFGIFSRVLRFRRRLYSSEGSLWILTTSYEKVPSKKYGARLTVKFAWPAIIALSRLQPSPDLCSGSS